MWIGPAMHLRLCRARDLLAETDQAVRVIAEAVGISPFHFIRVFDAVFGVTPAQYRTTQRIERARELLARDHSVTEVCLELGFSSLGSFSNAFTKRVGMAPSKYRRFVQVPRMPPAVPGCFGLMSMLPAGAFRNSR
jgi:transcriptional regulator GlxA family with amidase domain